MSVLDKENTDTSRDNMDVTTDLNPVVPGAVNVSGTLEPQGAVSATARSQGGAMTHTALPISGSINVTSPYGDLLKPTQEAARVDKDGCPI